MKVLKKNNFDKKDQDIKQKILLAAEKIRHSKRDYPARQAGSTKNHEFIALLFFKIGFH